MLTNCRIAELQCKEVVNLCDGCRLGYVSDVVVDICSGKLLAIVVPGRSGVLNLLLKDEEHVISWDDIEKIGDDIILVRYQKPQTIPHNDRKERRFRF